MNSYDVGKRILDVVVAVILLILFLPFWIIIPALMMFDTPGPILFRQPRAGKNKKSFHILKFRSMIPGADDLLWKDPRYKNLQQEFKQHDWKLPNDPRTTRVGKLLRKLSIDEFPQLFNVLRGEMSIVGPRAYREQELEIQAKKYPQTKEWIAKALTVKPGITGLWQVSGRNDVPFDKRVQIDAEYAERHSLLEDVWILLRTPKAMLSRW